MSAPAQPVDDPEIHILILGDAGIGKSTFIARLTQGTASTRIRRPGVGTSSTPAAAEAVPALIPVLRDENQPFTFDVRTRRYGPLRLLISDTSSPTNFTLLKPDMLILAFSVVDRGSLESLGRDWKGLVERHFNYDERMPVLVLGLKRDLRTAASFDAEGRGGRDTGRAGSSKVPQEEAEAKAEDETETEEKKEQKKQEEQEGKETWASYLGLTSYTTTSTTTAHAQTSHPSTPTQNPAPAPHTKSKIPTLAPHCIHPNEGIQLAQAMRCDRYAECSAATGELVREAWEDIVGMAVETRGASGGKSEGASCLLM